MCISCNVTYRVQRWPVLGMHGGSQNVSLRIRGTLVCIFQGWVLKDSATVCFSFSLGTHFGRSQSLWCEDARAALWRDLHREVPQPPANTVRGAVLVWSKLGWSRQGYPQCKPWGSLKQICPGCLQANSPPRKLWGMRTLIYCFWLLHFG